jgi:diguanylate cyclase (GGDEF)-like protein
VLRLLTLALIDGRGTLYVLAVLATITTLALLLWIAGSALPRELPRSRRDHPRDRRRPPSTGRRDAREALALVGDALAATHNPRALLPVILSVITEATGARGGQLMHGGHELEWVGDVDTGEDSLAFDLAAGGDEGETKLVLHAPPGGFTDDTRKLAEWLASQAAIALENARLHEIVQHQAITDELTGLVNRRRFLAALDAEILRARRLGGPLSVVLVDLDDFKRINDRFGHPVGDTVLLAFADLMRAHVREVDVAGRLGGEEFSILLPETDLAGAAAGAERLRHALAEQSLELEGRTLEVTASFGVAELSSGQSGDELLRAADAALYRAKEQGKNRVSLPAA